MRESIRSNAVPNKFESLRIIDRSIIALKHRDFDRVFRLLNRLNEDDVSSHFLGMFRNSAGWTNVPPFNMETAGLAIHKAIETFNARYGTVSMDMHNFRKEYAAARESGLKSQSTLPRRQRLARSLAAR